MTTRVIQVRKEHIIYIFPSSISFASKNQFQTFFPLNRAKSLHERLIDDIESVSQASRRRSYDPAPNLLGSENPNLGGSDDLGI